ncbi:hypothetical protein [Saccharicrinis aurantiacus]|uniref:hypothetical protein n=1 Tax=Saccharicrinis aurantiacus TaxID=1849719 RepID=UPI002490842F|nr:hypothetical protein [Saccharicrinis aurantiacus]
MVAFGVARKEFSSEDLHFGQFVFELDSFEEYLRITNLSVQNRLKSYLDKYYELGELSNVIFDSGESYVIERTYQLYYSSIIISLYSFLEQSMLNLCEVSNKEKDLKIDDISGKGIFRLKKYLEKVVQIDFTEINDEWNEITKYNHLRNLFVHSSNSILNKTESKGRINSIKEIKHLKVVESDNYYSIYFENDAAIKNFIETIRVFLTKLYYRDYEKVLQKH